MRGRRRAPGGFDPRDDDRLGARRPPRRPGSPHHPARARRLLDLSRRQRRGARVHPDGPRDLGLGRSAGNRASRVPRERGADARREARRLRHRRPLPEQAAARPRFLRPPRLDRAAHAGGACGLRPLAQPSREGFPLARLPARRRRARHRLGGPHLHPPLSAEASQWVELPPDEGRRRRQRDLSGPSGSSSPTARRRRSSSASPASSRAIP